ncbi:hypothetical protein GQ42DRAFT_160925 [Ramicandelaber brevisporus]|nr:hypothetical protein GQ42DRAFT_160925 [Ramicandelaber brevisporus]
MQPSAFFAAILGLAACVQAASFISFTTSCPGMFMSLSACGCNPINYQRGFAYFADGVSATAYDTPDCSGPPAKELTAGDASCRRITWKSIDIKCE